jgi:rare lipoprotein A (peptidoglycan hydrolase)
MKIKLNGKLVETVSRNDLKNTFSPKHHEPSSPELDRTVNRPPYKLWYKNQVKNNKFLLLANGVLCLLILGMAVGYDIKGKQGKADLVALQYEFDRNAELAEANVIAYNELLVLYASTAAELKSKRVTGKVSFYSSDGCLGCHPEQITASGEKFDENAMTLAVPVEWKHIKMGTIVLVKNLDNGKQMTAKVNDRGGFLKYGRVADLSKGLYEALGAKTDKSNIEIIWN